MYNYGRFDVNRLEISSDEMDIPASMMLFMLLRIRGQPGRSFPLPGTCLLQTDRASRALRPGSSRIRSLMRMDCRKISIITSLRLSGNQPDVIAIGNALKQLQALGISSAAKKAHRFLHVRRHGSACTVTFNEEAIAAQKKYHGYFALVSNCEKELFECLLKYRRRETIEFFFESAEQLRLKKKLLSWMKNTPVYLMLQWYDAVEEVNVSTKLLSRRWTTEITARDRLFLEKLGVPGF